MVTKARELLLQLVMALSGGGFTGGGRSMEMGGISFARKDIRTRGQLGEDQKSNANL